MGSMFIFVGYLVNSLKCPPRRKGAEFLFSFFSWRLCALAGKNSFYDFILTE